MCEPAAGDFIHVSHPFFSGCKFETQRTGFSLCPLLPQQRKEGTPPLQVQALLVSQPECSCPPRIRILKPYAQCDGIRRWDIGEVIRITRGESSQMGLVKPE